jgi:2-iminobutanoate/2-iminopropanoate deaminase
MRPEILDTPQVPTGNATYSQVVRMGGLLFVSGQLGIEPATGQLRAGGQVAEYEQALENVKVILEAAGSGLELVGKTTIYMTNVDELAALNAVYARYFPHRPAKTGVEVKRLSGGALIEIEVVAAAQR